MKSKLTLACTPSRYGGIEHHYDAKGKYLLPENRRHCFSCKKDLSEEKPYLATFKISEGENRAFIFRPLCRDCAYAYGKGVIEKDGKIYFGKTEYREETK